MKNIDLIKALINQKSKTKTRPFFSLQIFDNIWKGQYYNFLQSLAKIEKKKKISYSSSNMVSRQWKRQSHCAQGAVRRNLQNSLKWTTFTFHLHFYSLGKLNNNVQKFWQFSKFLYKLTLYLLIIIITPPPIHDDNDDIAEIYKFFHVNTTSSSLSYHFTIIAIIVIELTCHSWGLQLLSWGN